MSVATRCALVRAGTNRVGILGAALLAAAALTTPTGAALPPATATISIDGGTVEGRISPLLYGQFMEFMYEGIKRGLHAELIRDRSFEEGRGSDGLVPHWNRYPDDRNDDYGLSSARDETVAYPTTEPSEALLTGHSLRVELRPAVITRHGVFQSRIPVRRGIEYRGSVWIRTDGFAGGVTLALERDETGGVVYAEAPLAAVAGDWRQYAFTLRPAANDPLARFAILFTGSGTVWIDQVSLIPGDAVDGVRADVLPKVKALAPAFIRWPGGNVAQDYRWQWGIGPRDERPTWINLSWKNEPEPGDFGTDEFIRFARTIGAEPSITVNVEGRGATAEEAAAWVEYCNGPATSTYGILRARNGHPEPYGVKYWEIGNEIWGDWVRGHSDAATYAHNLARYIAAMRAVDPSIKVIAVGDNDMEWNRTVARSTERFDYLAVHHYYSHRDMDGDLRNLVARPLHYERWYGEVDAMLRNVVPGDRPQLAINEWGLDIPESQQHSILGALYAARLMNVFERRGDVVAMSAVSDLVNGWPGGIIQASSHRVFVTPSYLVNRLYATRLGGERLPSTVEGPSVSTTREGGAVPVLDAVASRSADGRAIYIKAINTDLERAMTARITISHARVAPTATLERVVADSVAAVNGFGTPDAVRSTRESIKVRNSFSLELPRHSVTVLTLTVDK
jgi:alpha-L-arabinofuranosidase